MIPLTIFKEYIYKFQKINSIKIGVLCDFYIYTWYTYYLENYTLRARQP